MEAAKTNTDDTKSDVASSSSRTNTPTLPSENNKPGRKKKGRSLSPMVDPAVTAALHQAALLLADDVGFYGVASLLSRPLLLANVPAAVAKTESPPWIHWSKRDTAMAVEGWHRLECHNQWGYRMGRASVGTSPTTHGNLMICRYYELVLLPGPTPQEIFNSLPPNARLAPGLQARLEKALQNKRERDDDEDSIGGHVRVGWSMRTGDLQAPVGYDQWSYGIRSMDGALLHQSQRLEDWGGAGFKPGDIIGCGIGLDSDDSRNNHVRFFKNGTSLGEFELVKGKKHGGEAFTEITPGTYYPAVSGYLGGRVRANFGPQWICPPRRLPAGMKMVPLDMPVIPSTESSKLQTILKIVPEAQRAPLLTALEKESEILRENWSKFEREQMEFIRQERLKRNLSVQDLPDPE